MDMDKVSAKEKSIDSFLTSSGRGFKRLEDMVEKTTELPSKQAYVMNLMKLTSDVSTLNIDLIKNLSQNEKLAELILDKARVHNKYKTKISTSQLQQAIQALGYGLVYNEIQESLLKDYAKLYFASQDEVLRNLIKKSIKLAYITKELAKILNLQDLTIMFFAGLHRHTAEIILLLREPKLFINRQQLIDKGIDTKTAELAVLGYDLEDLTKLLLRKWNMPIETINLLCPSKEPAYRQVTTMLRFGEFVLRSMEDKHSNPETMRLMAEDFLKTLNAKINIETWLAEIKLLYLRFIETEVRIFNR